MQCVRKKKTKCEECIFIETMVQYEARISSYCETRKDAVLEPTAVRTPPPHPISLNYLTSRKQESCLPLDCASFLLFFRSAGVMSVFFIFVAVLRCLFWFFSKCGGWEGES